MTTSFFYKKLDFDSGGKLFECVVNILVVNIMFEDFMKSWHGYQHKTLIYFRMPNRMVVRTSDIRVSERVCLSSITLKKNATVYNDLIDEVRFMIWTSVDFWKS